MASNVLLLPAPNRNCPRVIAQSFSGIIAYSFRNHIFFIDTRTNPPVLDSKTIYVAHTGLIISLSFCKHESKELLASIGDDRQMKIWDLETKTCLVSAEVKPCTRIAEWMYGSSNTLIFPLDFKFMIKWHVERPVNGCPKISTGFDGIVSQMASNEKSPHLLAIGYVNGNISIINITQDSVQYKLRAHSNEITSLSWSPVAPNILLSASVDLSLRMWKLGEAQPTWTHHMSYGRQRRGGGDDKKKQRIIGICHPKKSNTIICSNLRGDIGEISFAESEKPKFENEKSKFSYYYQGSCDFNCKAALAFHLVLTKDGKMDMLYCFDVYKITVWNISEKSLTSQIPFMSQFVYDLRVSNVNPNCLAISNGEGILKVLNTQTEVTRLDPISVFVHLRTKIMTTSWHPVNENIIAYGTDEGRVGIIDTIKRKVLYSFETHHDGTVYTLAWGPYEKANSEAKKTEFFLYSVGGGTIYIHKENDAKGKAVIFENVVEIPSDLEPLHNICSELCWKQDYSCFCIGTYKGFVDIFNKEMLFLKRYNMQAKSIECLRWHPQTTYMSPQGSPLKLWLASCGHDAELFIVDTSSVNEKEVSQGVVKKLVGHKKKVISVCWSEHKDGFLVSGSRDSSVLVWDVLAGSIIATYLGHNEIVFSVLWSAFDEDVVMSAGQDCCVRLWKISEQTVKEIPDKAPVKRKMKKPQPENANTHEDNSENEIDVPVEKTKMSAKKGPISKDSEKSKIPTESSSNKKTLFPHYSLSNVALKVKEEHLEECIKLADILSTPPANLDQNTSFELLKSSQCVKSPEEAIKFGLFTDQLTALRMCEIQGDLYKASGDITSSGHLQLMAGNVHSTIKDAADNSKLTSLHISLAPSVSYSFWLEMCEKYALQLASEHLYFQSSFYYLACGKIYEAINLLADKGFACDALALAKSRLPESDPLIPKLVRGFIKKIRTGSKIVESMGYLSLNDALSAAKALASAGEPSYLRVAAYICRKFKLDKEADEYNFLCIEKCLVKYDYSVLKQLLDQEPCMQVYNVLAAVHETLHQLIQVLKKQNFVTHHIKDLLDIPKNTRKVSIWKGSACTLSEQSFIEYIHQLVLKELPDTEESSLLSVLEALDALNARRITSGIPDVPLTIALCLTKFVVHTKLVDNEAASVAFMRIFETSLNAGLLPKVMCSLFFPMCLSWEVDESQIACSNILTETSNDTNFILATINQNIATNITSYKKQPIESCIIPSHLKSRIHTITNTIADLLSIKKVEDYFLAYFVSSFINELEILLEKSKLNLKCCASEATVITPRKLSESKNNPENSDTSQQNNAIISEKSDEDIVEELLKLALEEAEEKERNLSGAIKSNDENSKEICANSPIASTTTGEVIQSEPIDNSASQALINDNLVVEAISSTLFSNEEAELKIASNDDISLNKSIGNVSDSSKNLTEHSVSNNETSTICCDKSNSVISEVNQVENKISVTAISDLAIANDRATSEVDLLNYEVVSSIPVNGISNTCEENVGNENITLTSSDIDCDSGPNNELTESNSISTEGVFNESDIHLVNEQDHTQCVKNIELFYNLASFVVQYICKDEFALLYYLKEKFKLLNHMRASEELKKYSMEKQTVHETKETKEKFPNSTASNELPAIIVPVEALKGTIDSIIEVDNVSTLEDAIQDTTEISPVEVLDAELRQDNSNVDDNLDHNYCSQLQSAVTSVSSSTELNSLIPESDSKINRATQLQVLPKDMVATSHSETDMIENTHLEGNQDTRTLDSEILGIENEVPNKYLKEAAHPEIVRGTLPKIGGSDSIKPEKGEEVDISPVIFGNLQNEIEETSELINILEKSNKFVHPNPFEVIQQVLKALFYVIQQSPCQAVQEQLHAFIHEIISWCEKYFVGDINVICQCCHKLM